jgi:hypothetical protein
VRRWEGVDGVADGQTYRMVTLSFSSLGVVKSDCPGRRRVNCGWTSSSAVRGMPGGHPSIMTPTARQCDSPNVVTRYRLEQNGFAY